MPGDTRRRWRVEQKAILLVLQSRLLARSRSPVVPSVNVLVMVMATILRGEGEAKGGGADVGERGREGSGGNHDGEREGRGVTRRRTSREWGRTARAYS